MTGKTIRHFCIYVLLGTFSAASVAAQAPRIAVSQRDGSYSVGVAGSVPYAFTSGVAAKINGRWLHASNYPQHHVAQSDASDISAPHGNGR